MRSKANKFIDFMDLPCFDHSFKRALFCALPRKNQADITAQQFIKNLIIPWNDEGKVDWVKVCEMKVFIKPVPKGAWTTLEMIIATEDSKALKEWIMTDIFTKANTPVKFESPPIRGTIKFWKRTYERMSVQWYRGRFIPSNFFARNSIVRVRGVKILNFGYEPFIFDRAYLTTANATYAAQINSDGEKHYIDVSFHLYRIHNSISNEEFEKIPKVLMTHEIVDALTPPVVFQKRRLAFLLGLDFRLGQRSAIHRASRQWNFELRLISVILSFV